jgi:hypothetical protein
MLQALVGQSGTRLSEPGALAASVGEGLVTVWLNETDAADAAPTPPR